MLRHLSIQNFAIIESIEIDFESGLNIIIGETGTGKSIIIDSLSILLGEKASISYVREGAKKAIIEGIFELQSANPVWELLEEFEDEFEASNQSEIKTLIIRREISASGNSRIFINDIPAQYNLLKSIGDIIIDFHGQFEHQSLINPVNHISILDAYCNNFDLLKEYRKQLKVFRNLINSYKLFTSNRKYFLDELSSKKRILEEIEKTDPILNEDLELENELKLLENSESIHLLINEISNILLNDEYSINNQIPALVKKLEQIAKYNSDFANHLNDLQNTIPIFKELTSTVNNFSESFKFDPKRIEEINQRLYALLQLKRKYGTLEEIISLKDTLINEVNKSENNDISENEILKEIENHYYVLSELAKKLTTIRLNKRAEFENSILNILLELGFLNSDFRAEIKSNQITEFSINILNELEFNNNGLDKCEFTISTNKGESPKELSRIASGGELSRIMLALKTIAASDKNLPMIVFDEIDSGVSGRIAQKVGETMKRLANSHQIICITHSPQVAAAGNCLIAIEKIDSEERTISISRQLKEDEKILEIAKFLSGTNVSGSAIDTAKQLIENYKNHGNY